MIRWVSDKSLSKYFKRIMHYPLLSREEEQEIARRARLGDVITSVQGKGCFARRSFLSHLKKAPGGSQLKLGLLRGTDEVETTLKVPEELPTYRQIKEDPDLPIAGMRLVPLQDVSKERRRVLGVKRGLLAEDVQAGSAAALADIRDYNRDARDKLIVHNLRWVISIAKQYQNRGLPLAELINEGNLGLIQAVSKFDERRKTRLTTYSNWWIRYYIVSALASRHLIKLPVKMRHLARRIRDSYGVLSQKLGRAPSIEELARELKVTPEEVSAAFDCGVAELSIDAMPFDDSKVSFEEVLRDTTSPSPAELSSRERVEQDVRSSLAQVLVERELYVVSRHFGVPMPSDRRFTIKRMKAIFGYDEAEIRHILCCASHKLASRLYDSLGPDGLKRYAKVTAKQLKVLPELLEKPVQESGPELLKIMRKLVKNIPSLVSDCFEDLDLAQRELFTLYWGMTPATDELNLRELGDLLGVSREAARQVKERAIRKLKKHIRPHAFDNFFRQAV